ncbi:MAG: ATP-binding domain-containing protein [Cyanobacteriota/Melainabacteria group bacterium]
MTAGSTVTSALINASIDPVSSELLIEFDGREVKYDQRNWMRFSCLCSTIRCNPRALNTSAVVIPLATQHYMMLERNLLYTGVTRQKTGGGGRPTASISHGGQEQTLRHEN